MLNFALNHMTVPRLDYPGLLDLAAGLGCVGVEVRNDLGKPLFDGIAPGPAGAMARDRGLRLVGMSQLYPFNVWSADMRAEARALIAMASAAGAETINLIPRNDGQGTGDGERQAMLLQSLREIKPLLEDSGMIALVEPFGFTRASLRFKSELVEAIDALDAALHFGLVHDTFHHTLAGGGPIFPGLTGIVHVSGVDDPSPGLDQMEDAHRVLVGEEDRLDNVAQLRDLLAAGYSGPVSFECFSPQIQTLQDPAQAIGMSMRYLNSQLQTAEAPP